MANFLEVNLGTCATSWVEQKARPSSRPKSHKYFALNNQDSTLMMINHILVGYSRLTRSDLVT